MKKFFITALFLLLAVIIGGAVLQKTGAQVDIDACQKEYNARRSKCITDNDTCTASGSDATFCNEQRNVCDEAAVEQQKKCLGLKDSSQDLPVVDVQPAPAAAPSEKSVQTNCQSAAEAAGQTCESASFACYDSCKPIKDSSFYQCQDACYKQSRACYQARNDAYDACVSGVTPPDVPSDSQDRNAAPNKSSAQPNNSSSLPEEIIVDGKSYAAALVDFAPTKTELEKIISVDKSSPSAQVKIGASNISFNLANLTETQPIITFNTDNAATDFTLNISTLFLEEEKLRNKIKINDEEASGMLQRKIANTLNQGWAASIRSTTISVPNIQAKPLIVPSETSRTPDLTDTTGVSSDFFAPSFAPSVALYPGSVTHLVVLDKDVTIEWVDVGGAAAPSITKDLKNATKSSPAVLKDIKRVFEIETGKAIMVAGWTAEDTLSAADEFIASLETAYGVEVDSQTGNKIIELYDGTIKIFNRKTGDERATLSTKYGSDIKRVEIAADGTVKKQIAVPRSEWPAFVAQYQKNRSGAWLWILAILIIGGVGYLAYRKKDKLIGIIKKEPKQSP